MATGTVHRTIRLLQEALEQLNVSIPLGDLERIGVMVNRAMSAQERSFHTPEHIFDLVEKGNPHMTLAALFHDIVYYQVDQGFTPGVEKIIRPYIEVTPDSVSIVEEIEPSSRAFFGCSAVFGFSPGQELSAFGGLNEFLSALVMDVEFEGRIPDRDLLITTASIEATIPFRGVDDNGKSPADLLAARVKRTNEAFSLGLDDNAIDHTVQSAVTFANKDVRNFAEDDVGRFLDNTWKLLPETNPSLRMTGLYSIANYRIALQKMEGFLCFLNPDNIFSRYKGAPPDDEYEATVKVAHRNVEVARDYLGIKLLTAAVLEALAALTGGDAPVSLFMGDIGASEKGGAISDHLPAVPSAGSEVKNKVLYDLLAFGRASASSFDLQNSPLSLFIYTMLGDDGYSQMLGAAKKMFEGEVDAKDFLKAFPSDLVESVARACGEMAFTRKEALLKVLEEVAA
jgi:hypothetical protein